MTLTNSLIPRDEGKQEEDGVTHDGVEVQIAAEENAMEMTVVTPEGQSPGLDCPNDLKDKETASVPENAPESFREPSHEGDQIPKCDSEPSPTATIDVNQNMTPGNTGGNSAPEVAQLPSARLASDGDVPEVCTEAPRDSDTRVHIPPEVPALPSLSGILGDHVLIDEPPPSPPPPKTYEIYPERKSKFTGLAQIGLGLISIACQGVAIYYSEPQTYESDGYNYFGTGIWSGLFFIIAGIVSIATVRRKTRRMIYCNLLMSAVSAGIFSVCLFAMSCVSLAHSNFHSRYKCLQPGYENTSCHLNRPLLIVDITMLVVALLDMFVSIKMAHHCYRTILKKKRDQLQYIRTPEGVLMVMNKGPDYTDITSNPVPSVCLRTQTEDILYPMQAQAVLKPPPYPVDERGELIAPPSYQGDPPKYSDIQRSKSSSQTSIFTRNSTTKGSTTATDNAAFDSDLTELSRSRSSSVTLSLSSKMPFTETEAKTSPGHSRQASITSSITSESNCVVHTLPDPYDKITVLEDKGETRSRGYFSPPVTANPDEPLNGEIITSEAANSGTEASGDSTDDYSTIDSRTSSVEYPHVIVVDSDEQETVHL